MADEQTREKQKKEEEKKSNSNYMDSVVCMNLDGGTLTSAYHSVKLYLNESVGNISLLFFLNH